MVLLMVPHGKRGPMKNFQVSWGPVGLHGPEIVEAICKFCGAKAEVHLS